MKHIASRLLTSVVTLLSLIIVLTSALVGCEESVPAIDVTPSVVPGNGGSTGGGENNTGGDPEEKPYLTVSPQSLSFESEDNSLETIKVSSNTTYRVSTNAPWIKLTPSGNDNYVVSVSANEEETMREDSVIIASTTLRQSVLVQQMGKAIEYTLSVDNTSITSGVSESTEYFNITTNDSWTASTDIDWVTLSPTFGKGDETVAVSFTTNNNPTERSGTITVKGANSQTVTISLNQSGEGYKLSIDKSSLSVSSDVTIESFTITSNDTWAASSSVSWATLSSTSGSGDMTIKVSFSENTSTSERTGRITIQGYNSGSQTINLSQSGKQNSGSDNGHDYVDLGLPSGLLWATCNVGANSPEEYGDYFAWGETDPKSNYDWSTYKWCNGSNDSMIKYCTYNSYGTVDHKTVLELDDDAAHVNWGGSWRMPTKTEQDELQDKCAWTWTTQSGVRGYKITGPNGNTIFLPAAGHYYGNSSSRTEQGGLYWSSSLCVDTPRNAFYLDFDSNYFVRWSGNWRCNGRSVRPVHEFKD